MKIECKEKYDLLQEQAHEIENKIKGYKRVFDELEIILNDIDYIAIYDIETAEYLMSQLPSFVNKCKIFSEENISEFDLENIKLANHELGALRRVLNYEK